MGTFYETLEVGNVSSGEFASVEALVDTGAYYTMVNRDILERLGMRATDKMEFQLADGTVAEYDIGPARLRLGRAAHVMTVVFGPPDVNPLIGAMTLQMFRLLVDSANEQLVPMPRLRARLF